MKSGLKTVCEQYLHEIGRSKADQKLGELAVPLELHVPNWKDNQRLARWLNKELARTHKSVSRAILSLMILIGIGGSFFLVSYYLNLNVSQIIKVALTASLLLSLFFAIRWLHHLWFETTHMQRLLTFAKDISPNQMAFIIQIVYQKWSKPFIKQMLSSSPRFSKKLLTRQKLAEASDLSKEYQFLQTKLQRDEAVVLLTKPTDVIRVITQNKHVEIKIDLSELTVLMRQYVDWLGIVPGMRVTIPPKLTTSLEVVVTVEYMKKRIQEVFWNSLEKILENINHLHIVAYDELNQLPYELGAPEKLTFNHYPDMIAYYHLRHATTTILKMSKAALLSTDSKKRRDKLTGSYSIPCRDAPLGLKVYDAADYPPNIHIPLVHAEAGMVKELWGPAVRENVDIEHGEQMITFLHLAGHGQEDSNFPGAVYLLLGNQGYRLTVEKILQSPLRPRVVFLSACVAGKPLEKSNGEPSELISAFLRRDGECVIAPITPVPDFSMPVLAILFHQAWQQDDKHDPYSAWLNARCRFQQGDWFDTTEYIVRCFYRRILLEHFKQIAANKNIERWWILRKIWLPETYRQKMNNADFDALLKDHLQDEQERQEICQQVLDDLCQNKANLDINEFSKSVNFYGSKRQ